MPPQAESAIPSVSEWQAEGLRLTLFSHENATPVSPEAWKEVVGEDPEKKVETPRIHMVVCEGPFASGTLTLRLTRNRTDWLYAPAYEPVLGLYEECTHAFIQPICRWIVNCAHLKRLAFGAALHLPVNDREEGYRRLDAMLHALALDPSMRELKYRVNRRRPSQTVGFDVIINRLATWSVRTLAVIELSNLPGVVSTHREPETYFCHLDLDVNTDGDYDGEISKDKVAPILDELISLAKEIAEKGDIP